VASTDCGRPGVWVQGLKTLVSSLAITLGSRKDRTDGKHLYGKGPKLPLRNSLALQDRPPPQVRTITCNEEAAPCSGSGHVLGTRSLPGVMATQSSHRARTEMMVN
jgi:hypothetical protein